MQKLFAFFISFGILFQVFTQPVFALNDGQLLVVEAWNLVNAGYLDPEKFDEIQWKKLRQKALEKPINNSQQAYAAIEAMLIPLGDPYTRLLRPDVYEAMKKSNIGSEINGVGLQLGRLGHPTRTQQTRLLRQPRPARGKHFQRVERRLQPRTSEPVVLRVGDVSGAAGVWMGAGHVPV